MLRTEKIEKIKKNSVNFFKSLEQFSLELNDPEAISKQLTVLKKVLLTEKNRKNEQKY